MAKKQLHELEIGDVFADDHYLWRVLDPDGGVEVPESGESITLPGVIFASRIARRTEDGCFRMIDDATDEENYNSYSMVELVDGMYRVRN